MASPALKPGIPVALQDLETSSPYFKQGASLRVTGKLQSYCVETAIAIIVDGSISLNIDTQHLRDISFRKGSIYQFIGELVIRADRDAVLQARIGRNVDGMDLNLYCQSLKLLRQFASNRKGVCMEGSLDRKISLRIHTEGIVVRKRARHLDCRLSIKVHLAIG